MKPTIEEALVTYNSALRKVEIDLDDFDAMHFYNMSAEDRLEPDIYQKYQRLSSH